MKTYDFTQVRAFADGLNEKLDRCDHDEGNECATVENWLNLYASVCREFVINARQWAKDVFAGRVAFDAITEQTWRTELERLYARALTLAELSVELEAPCYMLDEQCRLQAAVWCLTRLRDNWVTPKLAVGPSARRQLGLQIAATARGKIASLPALPKDWEPGDPEQRSRFFKIRAERLMRAKNTQS